jgi:hypothetical protein
VPAAAGHFADFADFAEGGSGTPCDRLTAARRHFAESDDFAEGGLLLADADQGWLSRKPTPPLGMTLVRPGKTVPSGTSLPSFLSLISSISGKAALICCPPRNRLVSSGVQ